MLNVTGLWSLQDRLCSKFLRFSVLFAASCEKTAADTSQKLQQARWSRCQKLEKHRHHVFPSVPNLERFRPRWMIKPCGVVHSYVLSMRITVSLHICEEKHSSESRSCGSFQILQISIACLANPHGRPNFSSLHIILYMLFASSDLHKCLFCPGPAYRNSALRRDSAAHLSICIICINLSLICLHSKISYNHNLWTVSST